MISIHAPREGCDGRTETETAHERQGAFQSTHPARGATRRRRAPREEEGISIHAPREGCDKTFLIKRCYNKNFNPRTPRGVRQFHQPSYSATGGFQSTHPARGATSTSNSSRARIAISIHAPREGCDKDTLISVKLTNAFQSTHPARGATGFKRVLVVAPKFQSTHPARGATEEDEEDDDDEEISIHAPREGCDGQVQ